MVYIVDVDDTICETTLRNYESASAKFDKIQEINELYDAGHTVIYWATRSKQDWKDITHSQLAAWGCKFDVVIFGQPLPNEVPVVHIS